MIACLMSLLLLAITFGQNKNQNQIANQSVALSKTRQNVLADQIGNWSAIGTSHTLRENQISSLPDGDVYTEYGVQTLTIRFYTDGKIKLSVELFQTRFASEAYGLATFIRNSSAKARQVLNKGNFLLAITGEIENIEIDKALLNDLSANIISEDGELPSLVFKLPKDQKLDNTDRYIIGPIGLGQIKEFADLKESVKFAGGTQAVIANYKNANWQMSLAIFEYHTPQLASDGYANIQKHIETLSSSEKNSHLLKRIGNYIVVATNIQDMPGAERIIAGIKYSPSIYWEGNKISNIPARFRPTDPLVFEEASQTANMVIRTFYWIGVMILGAFVIGLIAGGSLFYWNRYRQQKLGIDSAFSDAGGTVRLNLDEYIVEPVDYSISLVAKKEKKEKDKKNGGHK